MQDAQTLQNYLACFSEARREALQAQLPAAQREKLAALLDTRQGTPTPTAQSTTDFTLCLRQEAAYDAATDTYTLLATAYARAVAPDAAMPGEAATLTLCLASPFSLRGAAVELWAVDKTSNGWSQAKLSQRENAVLHSEDATTVTVTGFDYAAHYVSDAPRLDTAGNTIFGRKLVVRITGLHPQPGVSFGGQNLPLCTQDSGLYIAASQAAAFESARVDLPIVCTYATAAQQVYVGQPVNFSYMVRPAGTDTPWPDGSNNAWVDTTYTVLDGDTPVCCYTVPHGAAISAGSWTVPPPQITLSGSKTYTVQPQMTAACQPAGIGPAGTATAHWQRFCPALAQILLPTLSPQMPNHPSY